MSAWFQVSGLQKNHASPCKSCEATPPPDFGASRPMQVQLFCFEPVPATFRAVSRGVAHWGYDQRRLSVANGAFTSHEDFAARNGSAWFPAGDEYAGSEVQGIATGPTASSQEDAGKYRAVPLMVLDRHVREHGVRHIDILGIDTEGNDPLVLDGARDTLASGIVRYLEFEYHFQGAWATTRLGDVVQRLDGLGFVCYWIGRGRLWRISGCWHPAYEFHHWSNVGCVHESQTEWYAVMEGLFKKTLAMPRLCGRAQRPCGPGR